MKDILFMKKAVVVLIVILFSLTTQATVINTNEIQLKTKTTSGGGSTFEWEDDFFDESKIDISLSYNYIIDKSTGTVIMKDTFDAWYNQDWTRMKPITINNRGGTTFQDYVLDMTVYYDSNMQSDFRDLRFTDDKGNDLYYWIGEKVPGETANVFVRVPAIPPGDTTIYMFYGDPTSTDESNFDMIFTWDDRTNPDLMISYKNYKEGAWDPDVAFGGNRFLVAWEEGLGPEDIPYEGQRLVSRQIHGRTYDSDGKNPYPNPSDDLDLYISSGPNDVSYHAENPSIAYGNGKFFVAYEYNVIAEGRYAVDVRGALIDSSGTITKRFTISDATLGQYDPCVAYANGKFFVVWEDARDTSSNYDVYGRIFDSNGNPLGSDFQVVSGANCQDEPWICADSQGNFMVVYEDGFDPVIGPFSLYAQRYDNNGNKLGSRITIAEGSSSKDNIFPSVTYCPQTERYFVAWNDGDISADPNVRSSYDGNVRGKILDKFGNVVYDNFIVQAGSQYIRTDVVPYLNTLFFVAFDGGSDLWGCLVSSDGAVQTEEHMLSDGSSQQVDWNNLAVGNGKIFATWEDERDQASNYADAFGSVWHIYKSTGSPDVTYNFGEEKQIITQAVVVSSAINPGGSFLEWEEFDAKYSTPIGNIQFDILNSQGTQVLMQNINPGKDISSIGDSTIRLRSTFTRAIPKDTPVLDKWSVSWIGADMDPPWTEYELIPSDPNGQNGWYTINVEVHFDAHDDVSPPEDIVTYYKINDGQQKIYSFQNPPKISADGKNNKIEYWSVDTAENEETHNILQGIKIDKSSPTVVIVTPQWGRIQPGDVKVSGTVGETVSGVDRVEIWFNGGKINEDQIQVSANKDYYEWHFTAEKWQQYDIEVWVYDEAGNVGKSYVTVTCPRARTFDLLTNEFLEKLLFRFPLFEQLFAHLF